MKDPHWPIASSKYEKKFAILHPRRNHNKLLFAAVYRYFTKLQNHHTNCAVKDFISYSSSWRVSWCSRCSLQAAGVMKSKKYSHRFGSDTAMTWFSPAQLTRTLVVRCGPFQHCCPAVNDIYSYLLASDPSQLCQVPNRVSCPLDFGCCTVRSNGQSL